MLRGILGCRVPHTCVPTALQPLVVSGVQPDDCGALVTDHSVALTDLAPGTYYYRVRSVDGCGKAYVSIGYSFEFNVATPTPTNTPSPTPSPTPTNPPTNTPSPTPTVTPTLEPVVEYHAFLPVVVRGP